MRVEWPAHVVWERRNFFSALRDFPHGHQVVFKREFSPGFEKGFPRPSQRASFCLVSPVRTTAYVTDQSAKQIVIQSTNYFSQQGWNPTTPNY
jgi:hypothetical protein